MEDDYLVIDYDDTLDSVVDSVNLFLEDYGLQFELDEVKNNESYKSGDGRMWWSLVNIDGHIVTDKHWSCKEDVYVDWYVCPHCESDNVIAGSCYCVDCGVKLEWDLSGDRE